MTGCDFLILDAARMQDNFATAVSLGKYFECLYEGHNREDLEEVAPYLFDLRKDSAPFITWLSEKMPGNSWGIFIVSSASLDLIVAHFRKFLVIKSGKTEQYFRFYDPRVLKEIFSVYTAKQVQDFFGPVEKFIVEGDMKEDVIEFYHENGRLKQKQLSSISFFDTRTNTFQ